MIANYVRLFVAALALVLVPATANAQLVQYLKSDNINRQTVMKAAPLPVSGDVVLITQNPTTSTSAYASGDVVGSKLTFASLALSDGGTGLIQEVTLAFKSAQTTPVDFFFCSSDPSGTTFTDNAAVAVAAADYNKCRAIHITDCTSMGTPSVCVAGNLAFPFDLASGTTGYGFLVTRGTPTLGSTSDVEVQLRVLRN